MSDDTMFYTSKDFLLDRFDKMTDAFEVLSSVTAEMCDASGGELYDVLEVLNDALDGVAVKISYVDEQLDICRQSRH